MAIFNNKVKAAIVFVGLVCALYGFSPVRGTRQTTMFYGGGTTGGSLAKPRAAYGLLPGHGGGTYDYRRGTELTGGGYQSD